MAPARYSPEPISPISLVPGRIKPSAATAASPRSITATPITKFSGEKVITFAINEIINTIAPIGNNTFAFPFREINTPTSISAGAINIGRTISAG